MNIQQLLQLLTGQGQVQQQPAAQAPLGSGMADQARQILMSQPYRMHVQESMSLGVKPMEPMEFLQWMQSQQEAGQSLQQMPMMK